MMSTAMQTWFDERISSAPGKVPIICWENIQKFSPDIPVTEEHWEFYATEQTARYDHIASVFGTADKCMFNAAGDVHMLGLASESQSKFDTPGLLKIPTIHSSGYAHVNQVSKGDWDHLQSTPGSDAFGFVRVTDNGTTLTCNFEIWKQNVQVGTTMTETIVKKSAAAASTGQLVDWEYIRNNQHPA